MVANRGYRPQQLTTRSSNRIARPSRVAAPNQTRTHKLAKKHAQAVKPRRLAGKQPVSMQEEEAAATDEEAVATTVASDQKSAQKRVRPSSGHIFPNAPRKLWSMFSALFDQYKELKVENVMRS